MRISTFFDPYNTYHIEELLYFFMEDEFSEEFEKVLKENNVFFTKNWKRALIDKMADCWMDHMMKKLNDKRKAELEIVENVD